MQTHWLIYKSILNDHTIGEISERPILLSSYPSVCVPYMTVQVTSMSI